MHKNLKIIATLALAVTTVAHAQVKVDLNVVSKIKTEGFENSQIMKTASYLTDVYGPRLSNSPNERRAMDWAQKQLIEWGMSNVNKEAWGTFGRGWSNEGLSIEMTEPSYMVVHAAAKAWTASTNGTITGVPVLLDASSEADFEKYRGKLQGAIVLRKAPKTLPPAFKVMATRRDDESLAKLTQSPEAGGGQGRYTPAQYAEFRKRRAWSRKMAGLLKKEGVAVVLEPSPWNYGAIRVSSGGSRNVGDEQGLPQLVLAVEHYNRIARIAQSGENVSLRINVKNKFYENDSIGYNLIAEIPGQDKKLKKEIVMLGGHFDSWHSGTGATDNASGSSVMMEAIRILKAIGVKPRRTIRMALWSGEEQGLLGSRGYVKKHFGDSKTMKLESEHELLSAYYNIDNGTGKIRGIYLQGNDAIRPIFAEFFKPFHDLGAKTLTIRNTGGTDHLGFDAIGLPGFQFIQDPIEYSTRTHHSNLDVYDHLIPADLKQMAVIVASFVYHTAMMDEKMPREALPKPRKPRGGRTD